MAIQPTPKAPEAPQAPAKAFKPKDHDLVTVLSGYGRVPAEQVFYIDDYAFKGGVGRGIPYYVAKAWEEGRRSDGNEKKKPGSRVKLQAILPEDATVADFVKVTGIQTLPPEEIAAHIGAANVDDLFAALGRGNSIELAERLLKAAQGVK